MKFEISHEDVIAKVTNEIDACRSFQANIENHLAALRNVEEDDQAIGIAKSIAYNNRMIQLYLERAAAMLKMIGLYDSERDELTINNFRAKLAIIKTAGIML